ncbi:MAG: aminoacyl-tRNA hydrolase [Alphaproteobacteria bacterium]|nr:aminoacyl-tRNA hydrolase [Alphaproteobacteria bacterium]MCB9791840.1 aminoacyl-tRNA hydrolase [Alphaproteobacteria bacterium]
MWLMVGLGNPGRRYEETRHNAGFLVVDRLAERWGVTVNRDLLGARVGDGTVGQERVVLAKPQSYMNRSGHPTRSLMGLYKLSSERLVVVHDEVDLPFGTVRVKAGGGHGGHNGLRDLNTHLDDNKYIRVRVGVSRPPEGWDTADYVLGKWSDEEREGLAAAIDLASDAVEAVLAEGPIAAMNQFNIRQKKQTAPTEASEPASSTTVD